MKKALKLRLLLLLLTVVIVLGVFPMGAFADPLDKLPESGGQENLVGADPVEPQTGGAAKTGISPLSEPMEAEKPVFSVNLSTTKIEYALTDTVSPLSVTATTMDGGVLSYQWEKTWDPDNQKTPFMPIYDATESSYTPAVAGTVYYRVTVTNTVGQKKATATSEVAVVSSIVPSGMREVLVSVLEDTLKRNPRPGYPVEENSPVTIRFYQNNGYDANSKLDLLGDEISAKKAETEACSCAYLNRYLTTYVFHVAENLESISYRAEDSQGNSLGGMTFPAVKPVELGADNKPIVNPNTMLQIVDAYIYDSKTDGSYFAEDEYQIAIMDDDFHQATLGVGLPESATVARTHYKTLLVRGGNACMYTVITDAQGTAAMLYGGSTLCNQYIGSPTMGPWEQMPRMACHMLPLKNFVLQVPTDAKVQVLTSILTYNNRVDDPVSVVDNGDGTTNYTYHVTNNSLYRVSMAGKITQSGYASANEKPLVINFADNEDPKSTACDSNDKFINKVMESSTLLNINAKNHLVLNSGEQFKLRCYRGAWQITASITGGGSIDPDFHYQVVSGGDVINVLPDANFKQWANLTPQKAGMAVIEVSYDALKFMGADFGGLFGATHPDRTGVFVVTVDQEPAKIDWHIGQWDSEFDTVYYADSAENGNFFFAPTAENSTIATVACATVKNGAMSAWSEIAAGNGGAYTVPVKAGNNLICVSTSDGKKDYLVVRAAQVTPVWNNLTNPGEPILVGDDVCLTFKGLFMPVPKLSAVYNPGFGSGAIKMNYSLDGKKITSAGAQYDFISNHGITFTAAEAKTYAFSDGSIYLGCMGDKRGFGTHRQITDDGLGQNFNAIGFERQFCVLPNIELVVGEQVNVLCKFTLPKSGFMTVRDKNQGIVPVDSEKIVGKNKIISYSLPYGDYKYSAHLDDYFTEQEQFHVGADDKKLKKITVAFDQPYKDAWDGVKQTPVTANAQGVYEISTGAELAWFADQVNHHQGANFAVRLTKDICLGNSDWISIGNPIPYSGVFDGGGHTITGLYIETSPTSGGLFQYTQNAVIKHLTVEGTIKGSGKMAGIVVMNTDGLIKNCVNKVNIETIDPGQYADPNFFAGGIAGRSSGLICNSVNEGTISGSGAAGGIAGLNCHRILDCYNRGDIRTLKISGGIAFKLDSGSAEIINCYNTGMVTVDKAITFPPVGAIVGTYNQSGKVNNCYYLEGSCLWGDGSKRRDVPGSTDKKTATELKDAKMIQLLGAQFIAGIDKINEGYPTVKKLDFALVSIIQDPQPCLLAVKGVATLIIHGDSDTDQPLQYSFDNGQSWQAKNSGKYYAAITFPANSLQVKNAAGTVLCSPTGVAFGFPTSGLAITEVSAKPTDATASGESIMVTVSTTGGTKTQQYSFDDGQTWQNENTKTYDQNITIAAEMIQVKCDSTSNPGFPDIVVWPDEVVINTIEEGKAPEFGLRPAEIKGHVTINFEDFGKRVKGEGNLEFADPLGMVIAAATVPFAANDTIEDVTVRLLRELKIDYEATGNGGFYLAAIKNFTTVAGKKVTSFGQFDSGKESGWMITVNNWFINQGVSTFQVEDGDYIRWQNTCQLGADLGCDWNQPCAEITGIRFKDNYGQLSPAFTQQETAYTYTVPSTVKTICLEGQQANYGARLSYTVGEKTYKPMQAIPVSDGMVIRLDCAYRAGEAASDSLTITVNVVDFGIVSVAADPMNITTGKVTLTVTAKGGIAPLQYSFDGGKNWQKKNSKTYAKNTTLAAGTVQVKDATGNRAAHFDVMVIANIDTGGSGGSGSGGGSSSSGSGSSGGLQTPKPIILPTTGTPAPHEIEVNTPSVTTDKNGTATIVAGAAEIKQAIDSANNNHQHHITFNLHVRGEAKRIELEIPIAALANLGRDDQINMSIKSTIGEISLDAAAINGLAEQMGNTVVIALGRNQDGTIVVEIKVGDKVIDAITGEIRVVFSARGLNTGSVPVLIGIDGKETLSRKSYVDGQKMVVLMNGSGILKIRDNALKFNDIQPNYWGKGAVDFVTARRLFLGSSTNEFNTKGGMTRGMLATVFYRLENTPAVTSGHKVPAGIKPGAYYAQAAVWANANQIINGTDKGFEPELAVSNEQLAVMAYAYAKATGIQSTGSADLSKFTDAAKISPWAKDGLTWAVANGVILGNGNNGLDPQASVSRGSVAAVLERLVKLAVQVQ